jgi:hypothetical protein
MEAIYSCNYADFVEAQRAHYRSSVSYRIFLIGGSLSFVAGALLLYYGTLGSGLPLLAVGVFWLLWPSLVAPFCWRRAFRKYPNLTREYRLHADEEGMKLKSDISEGGGKWAVYSRFKETGNLVMVYCGGNIFVMIPKRGFVESAISDFRTLLCRHLPKR